MARGGPSGSGSASEPDWDPSPEPPVSWSQLENNAGWLSIAVIAVIVTLCTLPCILFLVGDLLHG
jgi:hypothetical protein